MEFCDKESLLLFSLSSSRCLWAIDLIVTTIICRQWFQLKWFLAMIWPWLLFDYYHPKSSKSRFAQCFQWFSRNSAKQDVFGKNRTTLENTAFYPLMPENSDRRHCSCQALSLCKKARRKLMHLSLRLAFARTDCTPHDTLCTYGAKQLKLLGFSQRHLFGCSLMCNSNTLDQWSPNVSNQLL